MRSLFIVLSMLAGTREDAGGRAVYYPIPCGMACCVYSRQNFRGLPGRSWSRFTKSTPPDPPNTSQFLAGFLNIFERFYDVK